MMRHSRIAVLSISTLLLGAFAGGSSKTRAKPDELGGEERYLTAVSTDKPIYRPGETLYVRGVLLDAFKNTPLPRAEQTFITLQGPKGDTVAAGGAVIQDSVWAFSWNVPPELAGGEYTIRATYPYSGHAPAERKFDVRAYRAPRLKSQIVFLRDGYGPGDKVTATLEVKRAEGGVPAGAKVTATARVDGQDVARVASTVDAGGISTVSFELPKRIERGEGSLAFAIEDGGIVETAAKTIPILLQTIDLAMYPEGGDLIAGVANRVYFEAKTPSQKPADIAGEIMKNGTTAVATFKSEHEGRGRFQFTPEPGAKYTLKINQPSGIATIYPLPKIESRGVAMRVADDVIGPGQTLKLELQGRGVGAVNVTLSKREVDLASAKVSLGGGAQTVQLDPRDASGVLIATVWDEAGKTPLAERLVFRRPKKSLAIELRLDKKSYAPGGTVKLTAKTTEDGKPVSAVVGLTVTDDTVLELIEKREQAPNLPVMVFLEPEVKELADAHVYLDAKNPKSSLAVDLLLGTQGWRRFVFMDPAATIATEGDPARRALALRIQARVDREEVLKVATAVERRGRDNVPGVAVPKRAPPAVARPQPPPQPRPPQAQPPQPAPVVVAAPPRQAVPAQESQAGAKLQDAIAKADVAEKKKMIAKEEVAVRNDLIAVRQYAHEVRPGRKADDRVDFTETLFWSAGIRTDANTGEATVSFGLNDSVTSFKASAGGFGANGAIGASVVSIESVQPFYLEPKLPLEVTSGDVIRLPLTLVNGTADRLAGASVQVTAKTGLNIAGATKTDLSAGQRARQIVEMKVGVSNRPIEVVMEAAAGDYRDHVTRTLSVKPNGFPFDTSFGGMIAANGVATHEITLPADVVPSSVKTNIAVYPTPLANMTEALARLIQDPNGCFEQTSSSSYPLTMAQQYFMSHTGVDPKLIEQAKEKLEAGYKRLVGFETQEKGYEWFGESPGHEALTAYGILHFTDMAQVRAVDAAMLQRSRDWLMKQRDGKGGFERKRRALHTWIEDKDCSSSYITWSLLESGQKGLEKEVAAVKSAAMESKNSYVVALGANILSLAGDKAGAKTLLGRLAQQQDKTGVVRGGTASIVGSGGEALEIETTSLAVLGWLRDPAFAGNVEQSMKYLADSCQGGRYGSTQSTVLALRAIVTYDKARSRPKASGNVRVFVDGQAVGSAVPFDTTTQGAIKLPDVSELLGKGKHKIELKMQGGGEMPYAIAVGYNAMKPDSSPDSKVNLETKLTKSTVSEGELVEVEAVVTNRSNEVVPTPVAIIGLPGGLEPRHDQLKELVKSQKIDAYEVIGREVVLYWRGMEAKKSVRIPLSLVAAVPGTYSAPASRAYLYYTDEHKTWVDGLRVTVTPKS